jgi:hypothetical protein
MVPLEYISSTEHNLHGVYIAVLNKVEPPQYLPSLLIYFLPKTAKISSPPTTQISLAFLPWLSSQPAEHFHSRLSSSPLRG